MTDTAPDTAPETEIEAPGASSGGEAPAGDGGNEGTAPDQEPTASGPEVPDLDHDGLLDWIDAGSRERAEAVLAAQAQLLPEQRDARLVVDLTAWLEGASVEEATATTVVDSTVKLASTTAREQEMYEAEQAAWERENPGARPALEAAPADDPGAVA